MNRQRWFETLHPSVVLVYLAGGMVLGLCTMHPVVLGLLCICALSVNLWLRGAKRTARTLLHALALCCFITALNALCNHSGATELCMLFGAPITLEALAYGLAASLMLLTMWLWCAVWQCWMTSERFLYLFGNLAPTLSLMLSMVFALIPQSGKKLSQIRLCGKLDEGAGKKQRVRAWIRQVSALLVMDMEDSMQTSDAMRCKGYGVGRRTSFSLFRFAKRDAGWLAGGLVLFSAALTGAVLANQGLVFYPWLFWPSLPPLCLMGLALFALLPLLVQGKEWISCRWFS